MKALLAKGAPWEAIDTFVAARDSGDERADLLYHGALAYARAGATREAKALLVKAQPDAEDHLRHEILCLRGRLAKDRAIRSDGSRDVVALAAAREAYLAANTLRFDPYSAINAATLSLLLDERERATSLALAVIADVDRKTTRTVWEEASLAEALLLIGHLTDARAHYTTAASLAEQDAGSIATMRRQLSLLAHALPEAVAMRGAVPEPTIVCFSGHMIDVPGAAVSRFPAALETIVCAALRAKLAHGKHPIVFASAACGADLLFIEAALDVGAEVNVVLPFPRDEFVETSVAFAGASWVERFDRALARATRVVLATNERYLGDDVLFDHALRLVEGLAFTRARQLETTASLLCVLDSTSESKVGGTRAAFDRWIAEGGTPDVIDLALLREAAGDLPPTPTSTRVDPPLAVAPDTPRPRRTIKTMLFADIAGFAGLHDAHAPLFQSRFLDIVSTELAACAVAPLQVNTWGDAVYAVFATPEDATAFALGLRDRMNAVDWAVAGLSAASRIRIALHTGPVFCGFDPVIGRDNYFGASVTTAARIEPVTPPGTIYASEAFVATLAALRPTRFRFDYVGVLALAKQFGEARLFVLEHADA